MKRYTRKFTVEIGNMSTDVHVEIESDAIERGVEKLFGSNCFWFPNSGVAGYGQVFKALRATKNNSNPGNSSVTSMISLDVTPVGKPSRNFVKQQKQDAIDNREITEETCQYQERKDNAYYDGRRGNPKPTDKYLVSDWLEGQQDQKYEEQTSI